MKMLMEEKNEILRNTPMFQELADWFYSHNETEVISNERILKKIKDLKEARGTFDEAIGVTYQEYQGLIVKCRIYLEDKHQKSVISVRVPGEQYCSYKLTNEQEGTYIGVKTGKEVMNAMVRFRRRIPMIKKKYVWPSLKKVFGEAQEEIVRFRSLSDKFIEGYVEGKELENEQKKNGEVKNG